MATAQQLPVYGLPLASVQLKEAQFLSEPRRDFVSVEVDDPLARVQNLVWIKSNTYYNEALDDWKQQKKSLEVDLDRWEKRKEELTNQVYNLVSFFSVFQGVILTAVTQLNSQATPERPLCNKVWYPLVLALLALIAVGIGIGIKFIALGEADTSKQSFYFRMAEAERRESLLQTRGAQFFFQSLKVDRSDPPPKLHWLSSGRIAVIIALIVFTGIFCLSYFAILCDKLVPLWI